MFVSTYILTLLQTYALFNYHDAFTIPGISPLEANSLKQILQILKSLIYPALRPHFQQRLTTRVENLGFLRLLRDFTICACVAIGVSE